MNKDQLLNGLKTRNFGKNLFFYDAIESTNLQAIELLKDEVVNDGAVVIAANQTQGRGTSDKKWESANTDGLWMSVVVYEPLKQTPLAFVPGIAFAKTLREVYGIDAHLKWPNDILVGSKKIAGILCESTSAKRGKAWVVGIGLNVNQVEFPESIRDKAVSMKQITGNEYSVSQVFQQCIYAFEQTYLSLIDAIATWKNYSNIIGKKITATHKDIPSLVQVLDISDKGMLIIEKEDGKIEEWASVSDLDIDSSY